MRSQALIHGRATGSAPTGLQATHCDSGIYWNIVDFAKWDTTLYTNKLPDPDSRKLAFTPKDPTADPDTDYGFGWRLSGDTEWHSGESQGFRNVIIRWPKQHVTVVILSNRNHFKPYPLALTIGELFLAH